MTPNSTPNSHGLVLARSADLLSRFRPPAMSKNQVSGQTNRPLETFQKKVCGGKDKICARLVGKSSKSHLEQARNDTLPSWQINWVKSLRWYSAISHQLGPTSFQLNCHIWCPPTSSTRTTRSTTLPSPFTGSTRFQFLALPMLPQLESAWAGWLGILIIPSEKIP